MKWKQLRKLNARHAGRTKSYVGTRKRKCIQHVFSTCFYELINDGIVTMFVCVWFCLCLRIYQTNFSSCILIWIQWWCRYSCRVFCSLIFLILIIVFYHIRADCCDGCCLFLCCRQLLLLVVSLLPFGSIVSLKHYNTLSMISLSLVLLLLVSSLERHLAGASFVLCCVALSCLFWDEQEAVDGTSIGKNIFSTELCQLITFACQAFKNKTQNVPRINEQILKFETKQQQKIRKKHTHTYADRKYHVNCFISLEMLSYRSNWEGEKSLLSVRL